MTSSRNLERVETIYGAFYCIRNDLITQQLKKYSAHNRNELAMILSFLDEGNNVIDIGAHIGTYSIAMARFCGSKGKVFAFEGAFDNYELLQKNIEENDLGERINAVNAVVSEKIQPLIKRQEVDANTGAYYFVQKEGTSSPQQDLDQKIMSLNIDEWFSENNMMDTPIHLMKIDVEGTEPDALRACKRIIETTKPMIYCEINRRNLARNNESHETIESFLLSFGYHLFRNIGERTTDNDKFVIARIRNLSMCMRGQFDVLAIHPSDPKYPRKYSGIFLYNMKQRANNIIPRLKRYVKSADEAPD